LLGNTGADAHAVRMASPLSYVTPAHFRTLLRWYFIYSPKTGWHAIGGYALSRPGALEASTGAIHGASAAWPRPVYGDGLRPAGDPAHLLREYREHMERRLTDDAARRGGEPGPHDHVTRTGLQKLQEHYEGD